MNRDRYILKRNEYDLLMAIEANTGICPIRTVAGITREEKLERCCTYIHEGCGICVQHWLNEGGRKMYIDGKWLTETETNAYVKELKELLREAQPLIKRSLFVNHKDTAAANEWYDKVRKQIGGSDNENT